MGASMYYGNLNRLSHKELVSKAQEKLGLSAVLTDGGAFKDLFVHHEIIPPTRKSSSPHKHSHKEELLIVLSGEVRAHFGEKYLDLSKDDYIAFEANGDFHFVENLSGKDAHCLVICSNPKNDRVEYA